MLVFLRRCAGCDVFCPSSAFGSAKSVGIDPQYFTECSASMRIY